LKAAADSAKLAAMPYQRGPFWARRFRKQAEKVCAALAALMAPPGAPGYLQSSSDARVNWLDRSPSVSVCQPPRPPARLASVSRSDRAHRRDAAGRSVRLNLNTHLLHGEDDALDHILWLWRSSAWMRRPRRSPCSSGKSRQTANLIPNHSTAFVIDDANLVPEHMPLAIVPAMQRIAGDAAGRP
jgi:hypothetical protein